MELKYEITQEDYMGFNLYHLKNSPTHHKNYLFIRYGLSVLSSLIMILIGTQLFNQPLLYWVIIAVGFLIIWIINFPKRYDKQLRKQILKVLKEGDNSSFFGHKTMTIDDEKIHVVDEFMTEVTLKKNIKSVKVLDELILIYISGLSAYIIPTRNLTGEEKEKLLENLNQPVI